MSSKDEETKVEVETTDGPNGRGYVLKHAAQGYANYPHMRRVGDLLFVSGISSRREDNTHVGATKKDDGTWELDIGLQTRAVIENIRRILGTAGADLSHVVDMQCFLVDMKDYKGFNAVYNEFFNAQHGPSRTTIAVHQLPHPNLLIEIKAIAAFPGTQKTETGGATDGAGDKKKRRKG